MVLQRKNTNTLQERKQLSSGITYATINPNWNTQNSQQKASTIKQPQKSIPSHSQLDNVWIFGLVLLGGFIAFAGFVALLVNVIV
jgi:hypothetical protein